MRSAHVLAVRVLLLGSLLASAGCYRPKISPGGYACPEAGACPDGFTCHPLTHLCVSSIGGASGTGGTVGTGGAGGKDGGPPDVSPDRPCIGAVTNCQPTDAAVGMCDPVCNRGCGECYQKCSVDTNGDLTCNEPFNPTQPPAGLLHLCSQFSPADPKGQSDNCGPGQICLNASACGVPRCYQFCRGSSDCSDGASCSRDGGSYQFCDVPPQTCNPLASANNNNTSGCNGGLSCFLSQNGIDTVCDCQFSRAAWPGTTGRPGDQCEHSRDCLAGSVCLLNSGILGKRCYAVCLLPVDGGPVDSCAGGCQPIQGGGSTYGWCLN